jgi:AbrB family looped-hinge helix DNA binding protein
MEVHTVHLEKSGRILIPAVVRRKLGLTEGCEMIVRVDDSGVLEIESRGQVLDRIQARLRRYVPEGKLLSEELIQERKAESARENDK